MTFEQAHTTIKDLILNFQKNENHYLSPTYSEAEVRQEYIDPFFTALGWDVGSKINKNPHEREVVIEKTQSQEDSFSKKRADYAFYIAPNFKKEVFFVEAKKPSRTLRLNKEDYFQTAKYGYNSGTGISILFDFEEFVMIDCRFKPDKDTVLATQIKYYKYTDFLEEEAFSEIFYLFSREAVATGKLQNYIQQLPAPKKVAKSRQLKLNIAGQLTIDQDFLNFVEEARVHIAQAVYNNHPQLKNYELTEAVQKILDRLVFIRFLEDKSIEAEYIIQKIHTSPYPWNKFVEESKRLESKYNSIVFKKAFFDKEDFLDKNNTDFNETIIDFLASESPYNFNYIPIEIIGNIYERFLGKTIEIEENKVKIDLKPTVRKAGGVFYTPSYIVDYIIQNTIGKQIEDKSPKEIAKLTFADISCGSGSFLIGIFDYLIQYHQNYYFKNPAEAQKEGCIYDEDTATWKLSLNQKKQILLNNVYGVDIDHQATEVAQMSLLLKLLEHENLFTTSQQQSLFVADKILPTLSENIKSGNSLIGKDVVFQGKMTFDNYEEELKINPFDFEPAFPKVFKNGGFDAIVGNPPYLKELGNKEIFQPILLGEFGKKYYQGKMDFWYFFVHKGIDILKNNGYLSFITNSYWMKSDAASKMISRIFKETIIDEIVDFEDDKVFEDVSGKHNIIILRKESLENYEYSYLKTNGISNDIKNFNKKIINSLESFKNNKIIISNNSIDFSKYDKIGNYFEISQGVVEATDKISKKHKFENPMLPINVGDGVFVLSNIEIDKLGFNEVERKLLKKYLNTNNVKKYSIIFNNEYLLYIGKKEKYDIENNLYPNIKSHLDKMQFCITSSNKPYGIHRTRNQDFFEKEKLICKGMFLKPEFCYDDESYYCGFSFSTIIQKDNNQNLKVLLGFMNSKFAEYWFNMNGKKRGVGVDIGVLVYRNFPFTTNYTKEQEDKMIALVNQMLDSKQREKEATSDREKEYLAEHIKSLDYQIDHLVYEMYGLSDEEIEVVEGEK